MTTSYPMRSPLVETLIAEQSFTLIGGGSAAGKTTLIFQEIGQWLQHQRFLGKVCFRTPLFHYIALDRTLPVVYDHLNLLQIDFGDWVILRSEALEDFGKKSLILNGVNQGDILILDGLDMIAKSGNIKDFGVINDVCRQCKKVIDTMGISVIGLIGATKSSSNGNGEQNPMDRLLGSGVWQRISETNMLIEYFKPKDLTCPHRVLHIRPRFGAYQRIFLTFQEDSRLHIIPDPTFQVSSPENFLFSLPNRIFELKDAIEIGDKNGVSRRTIFRYIDYLVDEKKLLLKLRHGVYRKADNRVM